MVQFSVFETISLGNGYKTYLMEKYLVIEIVFVHILQFIKLHSNRLTLKLLIASQTFPCMDRTAIQMTLIVDLAHS